MTVGSKISELKRSSMVKAAAYLLVVGTMLVSLAGCDRSSDGLPRSERKIVDKARAAAAEKDVADGVRCMNLMAAIAAAKDGPLSVQIARLGLIGIEPEAASRWEARVREDARRANMELKKLEAAISEQQVIVLDEAELRASRKDASDCATAVRS